MFLSKIGFQEGFKKGLVQHHFRVPLDTYDISPFYGFYSAVSGGCGDQKAGSNLIHALAVIGIDGSFQSIDSAEEGVGGDLDLVICRDVIMSGDQLVQCTAKEYIQRLNATTNSQNGLSGLGKGGNEMSA